MILKNEPLEDIMMIKLRPLPMKYPDHLSYVNIQDYCVAATHQWR
jgi:hypothetical protein